MKKLISTIMVLLLSMTFVPPEITCIVANAVSDIDLSFISVDINNENVDLGENVNIEQSPDSEDFSEKVSTIVDEYDTGEYFSQIVINNQENTVKIDGEIISETEKSPVKGDVVNVKSDNAGIDIFTVLPEETAQELSEAIVAEKGDDAEHDYIPVSTLERYGYSVTSNEKDEIVISNPYQTKRLIVRAEKIDSTYGAIKVIADGKGCFVLQYDDVETAIKAHEKLENEKNVDSVTTDSIVTVSQITAESSNPLIQNDRNRWGAERIESDRYKDYLATNNKNSQVVVAVVDTGVDLDHPFVKDRLIEGYDFIDKDNTPDDTHMHGTHCSGILKDNTPDNVKIMPVKVFDSNGRATDLIISQGIDYAVKNGADIISMSFGGFCENDNCEVTLAVKRAVRAGVVCVAAAGNESTDTKHICPARIDECIVVSSIGRKDTLSSFSNYGDSVDIAAPGEAIWSSIPDGKYAEAYGTSMATPFASAAAAMLLTDNPSLSNTQVEAKLKKIVGDHGIKGEDRAYGAGILDFGVFFGDKDKATSITVSTNQVKVYVSDQVDFEPVGVTVELSPIEATNKAYTVKIADPTVAEFDGFGFVGKKTGTTTATFSLENGKNVTVKIDSEKRTFWIEKAAKSFAGGTGTKYDPYLVATPEQLARISYMGEQCLLSCDMYFKQIADIDLEGRTWYPILGRDEDKGVTRINYDGGGYEIRNLNISDIYGDIFIYYSALFTCNEGEMKNINMIDVDIDMPDTGVAPLCVDFGGTMKNCYASGKVHGYGTGGLVASLDDLQGLSPDTSIRNCRSDVYVKGDDFSGGICATISDGTIANCIFTGKTEAPSCTGGIVAYVSGVGEASADKYQYNNSRIVNCVSVEGIAGNIDNSYMVISSSAVGSDAVYVKSDYMKFASEIIPEIYNCYYSGDVKSPVESAECEYIIRNVEKMDATVFKTKSFYESTDGKWDNEYPWDMENSWTVNEDFPVVKANYLTDKVVNSFDYHEYDDHISVTGYYGKNPYVEIPAYIAGKPVTFMDFYFQSHNVDVISMKLPDTIRMISLAAFGDKFGRICETLQKVDLGNGVEYIGRFAFCSCYNLKAVTIPESFRIVDNYIFNNSNVEHVFFEGDADDISRKMLTSTEQDRKVLNIYYLKDKKGWTDFDLDDEYTTARLHVYDKNVPLIVYDDDYDNVINITYGKDNKLKLNVFPESASLSYLTYKSSNSNVSVDKNGNITVKENGHDTAIISVYSKNKLIAKIDCIVSKADAIELGKPSTVVATPGASSIKLDWSAVKGAYGYRVYQKTSIGWKKLADTTKLNYIISNLSKGTKYTFAVRAGKKVDRENVLADTYTSINTATKTAKPKVTAAQNTSAIKLSWPAVKGADGYRIYYKSNGVWKVTVSSTTATSHTFSKLKAGAKYTFAVRPYIKNGSTVIWSDYTEFTTATKPAQVTAKATSSAKGKVTLSWNLVNGADGYQIYYKTGNSAYKLYKTVGKSTNNLSITNIKSGTKYTFVVRAGIKTSGGNIYGTYKAAAVTVK